MTRFQRSERYWVTKISLFCVMYFFIMSLGSISMDPDGMHDGVNLLLAEAVTKGIYPPEIFTRYGAVQPLIEGFWLFIFPDNVLSLRILTVFIMMLMASGIFLVSRSLLPSGWNFLPTLVWIALNPVNDLFDPATQTTWPNLIGQTIIIWCVVIMLSISRNCEQQIFHLVCLGFLAGTLPFVRLQFIPPALVIMVFSFWISRAKNAIFALISCPIFPLAYFSKVQFRTKSVDEYFRQVSFVGKNERIRLGGFIDVTRNLHDFMTAFLLPSFLFFLLLLSVYIFKLNNIPYGKRIFCFIFTLSLFLWLTSLASDAWFRNVFMKLQYWVVGFSFLVVVIYVLTRLFLKITGKERAEIKLEVIDVKILILLLILFITSLIPPLRTDSVNLRSYAIYLLIPGIYGILIVPLTQLRRVLRSGLIISLFLSITLSAVGAAKYIFRERVHVTAMNSYGLMYSTKEKTSEHNLESRITSKIRSEVIKFGGSSGKVFYDCPVGIYHIINDVIYGDTKSWYQLDFFQDRVESVQDKILNLPAKTLFVGCNYSSVEFSKLLSSNLLNLVDEGYSSYSRTYSFVGRTN